MYPNSCPWIVAMYAPEMIWLDWSWGIPWDKEGNIYPIESLPPWRQWTHRGYSVGNAAQSPVPGLNEELRILVIPQNQRSNLQLENQGRNWPNNNRLLCSSSCPHSFLIWSSEHIFYFNLVLLMCKSQTEEPVLTWKSHSLVYCGWTHSMFQTEQDTGLWGGARKLYLVRKMTSAHSNVC